MGESSVSAGSHQSSRETKSRPRPHGTYSCGNHSVAVASWRSSNFVPTGSSSFANVWISIKPLICPEPAPYRARQGDQDSGGVSTAPLPYATVGRCPGTVG